MPAADVLQLRLNACLRDILSAAGCVRGRFDCNGDGTQRSLSGQKPERKTIFFWQFDRSFNGLLAEYLAEHCPPELAQLTIHLDLRKDSFAYSHTSQAAAKAEQAAAERQAVVDRRNAPRDHTSYGRALAGQVADALRQGRWLGYSHRDYCGMGLEYAGREYRYGDIWDGDLTPQRRFPDREQFVQWLAGQSDASLAGLESKDPWVWGNQRVTRARLQELVQSS